MRHLTIYACLLFVYVLNSFADTPSAALKPLPHYDLEMTGRDWRAIVGNRSSFKDNGPLSAVLGLGERSLSWIDHINQFRDAAHKLSLSSEATQTGIPITAPVQYNQAIVLKDYQALLAILPAELRGVLLEGHAFTDDVPIAESDYLAWGRKIDRVYSYANRWLMMVPFLDSLAQRRFEDVRGYYALTHEPDLETKLRGWASLGAADQSRLRGALIGLCLNGLKTADACARELKGNESGGQVWDFYNRYQNAGKSLWDNLFTIGARRSDLNWEDSPEILHVPFQEPQSNDVHDFLMNIEDEWHLNDWHLRLDFQNGGDIPHVVFKPNVTPHVNGIGGNEITMNSSQPLTEYDARWTIRHEFGHVLGFKDCYVEFYDTDATAMVSYQLDITNLMCSRRGKLKQTHYDELKRVYGQ